jgi:hypothetical protein
MSSFDVILNQYKDAYDEIPLAALHRPCILPVPSPRIDPNRISRALSKSEAQPRGRDVPFNGCADLSNRIKRADSGISLNADHIDLISFNLETIVEDQALVDEHLQNTDASLASDILLLQEQLHDGFLERVHYEEPALGGAHMLLKAGEEYTDPVSGLAGILPSSLALETYAADGLIGASVLLQGDLITLSRDVKVEGELILNEKSVADQLLSLEDKAKQYVIELGVNTALDLAQDVAIAALAAYSARPPSGYEAVPETGTGDEDNDKKVSLNPLALFPTGIFHHLNDLGAEYGVPDTVTEGKVSLNLQGDLCTRTFHMRGDLLQENQNPDDEVEFQSTCKLGSKVATYNTSNQLTNPQAVVARLGTNCLVSCDGTLNVASVNTDSITTSQVNGLATNKLIQRYQPTIDLGLSKRTARAVTSALQANRAIKTTLVSRDYSNDLLRVHDDLLLVKRAFNKPPVLSRSYDDAIVASHAETLSVKRGAYVKPILTRSADMAITRLRSDVTSVKRSTIHPVLARSADMAITRLRSDVTSIKRSTIHPVLARSADMSITRLRTDVNIVKHAANKVTLAPDFSSKLGVVRDGVSTLKAYTSSISTSTSAALKVVGTLGVTGTSTLAATTATTLGVTGTSTLAATTATTLGVTGTSTLAATTATTLGVTGTSTLAATTATTLGVTGTSTLASTNATGLTVTGTSTLAATTATTLGVSGNTLQLASATSNSALFDQGGLLLGTGSSQAKLTYDNASTSWVSNKGLTVPSLVVTGAISNSVNSVTTTFPGPTSSSYETWINVGSFTDSFTGTMTITIDNTDPKLCDCLDINICYNRSGLTPCLTATKSGNTNAITYYGFTGVSLSNYALNGSGQVHTLYVAYGTIPDGKTFTAAYILRGGNFTLSKPLLYSNPNTSTGFVGPRYDPTYSCINCVTGTNNALVTNFLNGTINIASAICDRVQVSQLTGKTQSILNPAVNSYFTLGSFRNQFSGHVRIVLTTSASLGNTTQVIDLAINYCPLQATSNFMVNSVASPGISTSPSTGITTAYISSAGDLVIKGPSIACNLYWTALNSDALVDNSNNGVDGWDESSQAVSTTAPSGGQVINISSSGNTGFNGVDISGPLNHTGAVANLCQVNSGNSIECSAGSGTAYIDFHAGANTDSIDFDGRVLVSNKNISLSAANGVSITAGPLNFGRLGQLLNTFSTSYGLGIQANTQYYRSAMHHNFFVGGSHSDLQGDNPGGNTVFALNGNTFEAYLRGADGSTTNVLRSNVPVMRSGQKFTPSLSSGVITFGYSFYSAPNVTAVIDDTTPRAFCVLGVTPSQFNWVSSGAGTSNMSIRWSAFGAGP